MSKVCGCKLCVRNRLWRKRGIPDDIMDYILDVEMDLQYMRSILDGSWPSGKEVLERALKNYE